MKNDKIYPNNFENIINKIHETCLHIYYMVETSIRLTAKVIAVTVIQVIVSTEILLKITQYNTNEFSIIVRLQLN